MKHHAPHEFLSSKWYHVVISLDLKDMVKYVACMDGYLKRRAFRFRSEERRVLSSPDLPSGAKEYWTDHHDSLRERFEETFPQAMRMSSFIASCALTEGHLKQICDILRTEEEVRPLKPVRHRAFVSVAHEYIQTTAKHPLHECDQPLAELLHYHTLRNKLVHDMGYFRRKLHNSEFETWMSQRADVSIDNHGRIVLARGFCETHLSVVEKYFTTVNTELAGR